MLVATAANISPTYRCDAFRITLFDRAKPQEAGNE
jgi:hypothetical protein